MMKKCETGHVGRESFPMHTPTGGALNFDGVKREQ